VARWAPPIAYAGLIFFLSSQSTFPHLPPGLWDFDKLLHAVEYAVLALLLLRATGSAWVAFALASLYGVSDELHQSFVPGRSATVYDALADAVGAALAVFPLSRRLGKRENR
jgi:VanZ family protein